MTPVDVDVMIVGAGLSGIGTAVHLQQRCPGTSFALLEARQAIGGTWDLFRYPGVRSDSDMHTLGYAFKPWTGDRALADGAAIRRYIEETAHEHGITAFIRFGHRLRSADWSSADARWTLQVERDTGDIVRITCRVLDFCSGYFSHAEGHRPDFPGEAAFTGRIVHPQFWPAGLEVAGRRVCVIGSGATAVTLVPALAATAAHVTMLQRSPGYVLSIRTNDAVARGLKRWLPPRWAYRLVRARNIALGLLMFGASRRWPGVVGRALIRGVTRQVGPGVDTARHFTPRYRPWDERLCLVPDGDLFDSLRSGRASVVTGTIDRFTAGGVQLQSGGHVDADIIVTATGLKLELLGGAQVTLDGVDAGLTSRFLYKGMMLAGVPNLVFTFGYTNASWTLKSDLTGVYLCRLLQAAKARGARSFTPVVDGPLVARPLLDFTSGYVQRAASLLPPQGHRRPWRLHQNYLLDLLNLRFGRVDDGVMRFGGPP